MKPAQRYKKGANKEREIVNDFKAKGWEIAFRSAGSRSPIDCVAINHFLHEVRFIQAKPDNFPDYAKEKLENKFKWLNGWFEVSFEVI